MNIYLLLTQRPHGFSLIHTMLTSHQESHTLLPAHFLYFHSCFRVGRKGSSDRSRPTHRPFPEFRNPELTAVLLPLAPRDWDDKEEPLRIQSHLYSFLFQPVYTGSLLGDHSKERRERGRKRVGLTFCNSLLLHLNCYCAHHQVFADSGLHSTLASCACPL